MVCLLVWFIIYDRESNLQNDTSGLHFRRRSDDPKFIGQRSKKKILSFKNCFQNDNLDKIKRFIILQKSKNLLSDGYKVPLPSEKCKKYVENECQYMR